jgi:hypothetical protein
MKRAPWFEEYGNMRKVLFALVGLAVLGATPAEADRCIRHNDIWKWSSIDDKSLILENSRHQKWMAKLVGGCYDFRFNQNLVIKSHLGLGVGCVQTGDTVVTRNFGISQRCAIISIAPYAPPTK